MLIHGRCWNASVGVRSGPSFWMGWLQAELDLVVERCSAHPSRQIVNHRSRGATASHRRRLTAWGHPCHRAAHPATCRAADHVGYCPQP
jgi:hypothetical protein